MAVCPDYTPDVPQTILSRAKSQFFDRRRALVPVDSSRNFPGWGWRALSKGVTRIAHSPGECGNAMLPLRQAYNGQDKGKLNA